MDSVKVDSAPIVYGWCTDGVRMVYRWCTVTIALLNISEVFY